MAVTLTEAEKLDIAKVLTTPGKIITYIDVNDKVANLGEAYITAAVETDIRELLTEWGTIKNDNVTFTATESNEGFNLTGESRKNRVRRELAGLLYFTDMNFGSQSWGYAQRA